METEWTSLLCVCVLKNRENKYFWRSVHFKPVKEKDKQEKENKRGTKGGNFQMNE